MEPRGGQPPAGSEPSVADFDYQLKYQRAFEAIMWGMPALAIYRFRAAAFDDLDVEDNVIIAYSHPATPKLEALTANSTTPYIAAFTDLKKGPVVLELPAASDASLYGQVVDAWQFTIADVGPSGLDAGKGGKYLFTPPDYTGPVAPIYLHVASPNFRIAFAFRSIAEDGSAEKAYDYAKRLRMYYLSDAAKPPTQRFVDPIDKRYATLPFYDERAVEDLHAIFSYEPIKPEDKLMMGMLKSLGIEKGSTSYSPDETTKRASRQAAIDVWFYLQSFFDNVPKKCLYWPKRHYVTLLQADDNRTFTFSYDDWIDIVSRAVQYFWATYVPKEMSDEPATQYLAAVADKDGKLLQGDELYKVDVPSNMPVEQFWALTVYDRATFSFIYTKSGRTTLSSFDLNKMTPNEDGSVTLYVGPSAPDGLDSNWIPSRGKRPLPVFRYYGPTDELNEKTFVMPDFELVPRPKVG